MRRRLAILALLGACTPAGEAPIYTSFDKGEVGGPCAADGDCKGPADHCLLSTFLGVTFSPPGGYCSRSCASDSECGPGRCVTDVNGAGVCVAFCDGPSHCRADYLCRPNQHCEPEGLYTLNCDPKQNFGFCTTDSGDVGGCIRNALGEGTAGQCVLGCVLGGLPCPSSGTQKSGCHYIDAASLGDPFQGLLCYLDSRAPPVTLGGACNGATDCVSGANCVSVDGASGECLALCDEGASCANGATCGTFSNPGPVGFCEP